jgi:hypothetical protein
MALWQLFTPLNYQSSSPNKSKIASLSSKEDEEDWRTGAWGGSGS